MALTVGKVAVLPEEVPGSDDPLRHVRHPRLRNQPVVYERSQVRDPLAVARAEVDVPRHRHLQRASANVRFAYTHAETRTRTHIQPGDGSEGGVVRTPVGHDVALEAELALEDLVQGAIIFARPCRVELV